MPYPRRLDRPAILAAARTLLAERGPDALSLRELGRRLGVTAPSLYSYIPGHDALQEALIDEGIAELGRRLEAATTSSSPAARAHAMAAAYLRFARDEPALFSLVFGPCPPGREPPATPGADPASRALFDLVAGLAPAGDAVAIAQAFWALVHGFATLLLNRQFRLPGDPEAAMHAAIDVFIAGLATLPQPLAASS